MAESDEWATVETVEDDVYYESRQPSSAVPGSNINDYFNNLLTFLIANAWYVVSIGIVLYILWQKFRSKIDSNRNVGPSLSTSIKFFIQTHFINFLCFLERSRRNICPSRSHGNYKKENAGSVRLKSTGLCCQTERSETNYKNQF